MTKLIIVAALSFAVLTTGVPAQANSGAANAAQKPINGYVHADALHEWCQRQPDRAMYYVAGVMDALTMAADPPVCVPEGATLAQARDVMCKYLRDNPAKRHYNTASSTWVAQSQAWPCKK